MPSALQQSRDILARGVAKIRSGIDSYGRNLEQPGAEISVEPFDAQNVSTPAALIKLGTSIAAARRHRANLAVAQETAGLEREKTRAEIARLRAEGSYYEGTGRQPAARAAPPGDAKITQGKYAGWTVRDAKADMDAQRTNAYTTATHERASKVNRLPGARAGLSELQARADRATEVRTNVRMAQLEPLFTAAMGADPVAKHNALTQIGIPQSEWDKDYLPTLLVQARAGLRARAVARVRAAVDREFGAKRAGYQSVIDEAAGLGEAPPPEAVSGDEVIDLVPDEQGNLVPAPR
jgi:hypothetical protein